MARREEELTVREFAQALAAQRGHLCAPPERDVKRCMHCGSRFDRRLNQRRSFCGAQCRHAWHALGRLPTPRLDFGP